jgi:hypothetical protein
MASPAVQLVADDGQNTILLMLDEGGVSFDVTTEHAGFSLPQVRAALAFLESLNGA